MPTICQVWPLSYAQPALLQMEWRVNETTLDMPVCVQNMCRGWLRREFGCISGYEETYL